VNRPTFALITLLIAPLLQAGPAAPYTDCNATVTNGVLRLAPLRRNLVFNSVLDRFSAEAAQSAPQSFILSGRVVSNNTGAPAQGVAISLRAPGQAARLAGITDVDGAFRFRVWIHQPQRSVPPTVDPYSSPAKALLELSSIHEGDLLLGGDFQTNRVLVSGTVSKYSLGDLTPSTKKVETK
jgi:hypothetical protein